MMCAAPSRSLQHKRANSDWVMLIGSACFASSGAAKACDESREFLHYSRGSASGNPGSSRIRRCRPEHSS